MFELSKRLRTIASLVPKGARVCDIGTDHGYLSIYLKENQIASSVIATDIREKPLQSAKSNIEKLCSSNIETRLCDGLSAIKQDEVDTIIIAGMGGEVIAGILDACEWVKNNPALTLILQPMTSAEVLRKYLSENGFEILDEPALTENSKIYSVIYTKYTGIKPSFSEGYYYIGEISPLSADGLLYIKKQFKRLSECAEALKNISVKKAEYLLYKKAADEIKIKINCFTENKV